MKTLNAFAPILCFALFVSMTACTWIPGPNTASGRPEITVRGMTEKQVRDEIIASYTEGGFKIALDDENSLALVKRIPSPTAWLKGRVKYHQVEFSIYTVGTAVHVQAICSIREPGHLILSAVDTTMSSIGGAHQIMLEKIFGEAGTVERPSITERNSPLPIP